MTDTPLHIRDAQPADAPQIARLIQELAKYGGDHSPIHAEYVLEYLSSSGNGIILAQQGEKVTGLLSYSMRATLYHAGNTVLIEELVVDSAARGQGVGGALVSELMNRLQDWHCVEVAVTVLPDNLRAIKFYKTHGLVDEAVFLEKHFI